MSNDPRGRQGISPEEAASFVQQEARCAAAGDRQGAAKAVQEAIARCEQSLTTEPNDLDTVAFLASCYMKLGRLTEAANCYRRAIGINPAVALLHQNLGLTLLHRSMLDAAEGPFRQAIALDPASSSHSFSGLAQILLGRAEEESAAAMFRKAYECHPDTAIGKFYLGRACIHEGNTEAAEDAFREAITMRPNFGDAYRLLGQVLQQQGRFEEAEGILQRALELDPNRGHVYIAIATGRKMNEADKPFVEQMRTVLNNGKMLPADECSIHYALGKALHDFGDYESALKEYDAANALALKTVLQGRPFDRRVLDVRYEQSVEIFTKEFFVAKRHLGSESDMPILVVGMMRSGTTLVEQILSSHPDIAAGGELPFWTKNGLGLLEPTERIINEQRLCEAQQDYMELLRLLGHGKAHVVDKRPGNYGLLGLIHLAFPKAKILHCKRDAVDTALSVYMTHAALIEFGHVRENIVYAYRDYRKLMDLYKNVLPPDSMLDVQYEEMVFDREGVTRRIVEFLGLEWSDACLHHEDNVRNVRTPSVWQARQPIYSTSVKRWKKYEPWLGVFKELIEHK